MLSHGCDGLCHGLKLMLVLSDAGSSSRTGNIMLSVYFSILRLYISSLFCDDPCQMSRTRGAQHRQLTEHSWGGSVERGNNKTTAPQPLSCQQQRQSHTHATIWFQINIIHFSSQIIHPITHCSLQKQPGSKHDLHLCLLTPTPTSFNNPTSTTRSRVLSINPPLFPFSSSTACWVYVKQPEHQTTNSRHSQSQNVHQNSKLFMQLHQRTTKSQLIVNRQRAVPIKS
jgi:hypothetical protein